MTGRRDQRHGRAVGSNLRKMNSPERRGPAIRPGALRAWWRERSAGARRALAAAALAVAALSCIAGAGAGYLAHRAGVVPWAKARLEAWVERRRGPADARPVERSVILSVYHTLDLARLPLGRAWSLEEVDGKILYASRLGRIGYLTPDYRAVDLNLATPMNVEAMRASPFGRNRLFEMARFRTTDLLAVRTAPDRYDLYAAYQRYEAAGCVRVVVSRTRLAAGPAGVTALGRRWEQVFQSRDCIRPKSIGVYFPGHEGGGRLAQLDADHLALAIGDFQFDGVYGETALPMDPASDLGKVIEITLSTGRATVMASGLRNPQGLLMSRDGVLWETEHGPQGGDEVNIIRPGANYGWPKVTYGMRYANRPVKWPSDPAPGRHDRYERPYFAFVPSPALSNLVEPDTREFPNWRDDLVVASLKDNTLFVLRRDGDHTAFFEPIRIDGVRIRDIISLSDGRIAFTGDDGDIRILSNAELETARRRPSKVAGLNALPPTLPGEIEFIDGGARWGAVTFGLHCSQCHSMTGEAKVGPPLNGVLGRRVGSYPGYDYSAGLSGRGEPWTKPRLRRFLADPHREYPGTTMPLPTTAPSQIEEVIDYLAASETGTAKPGAPAR